MPVGEFKDAADTQMLPWYCWPRVVSPHLLALDGLFLHEFT